MVHTYQNMPQTGTPGAQVRLNCFPKWSMSPWELYLYYFLFFSVLEIVRLTNFWRIKSHCFVALVYMYLLINNVERIFLCLWPIIFLIYEMLIQTLCLTLLCLYFMIILYRFSTLVLGQILQTSANISSLFLACLFIFFIDYIVF